MICPTPCLQRRNCLGLTTLDVLHRFNDCKIRLSFVSETARALGVHLYVIIYRVITLLSASMYIMGSILLSSHAAPLASEEDTDPARQHTVKICTFVCVCVRFVQISLPNISNIYPSTWRLQNFTTVNCAVVSNDSCQLIELSYRMKIIFNEQRTSYINIRLTNVKFSSGVSSYCWPVAYCCNCNEASRKTRACQPPRDW